MVYEMLPGVCACVLHFVCAVPNTVPLKQLLGDAMIYARSRGYDVFNALDLLQVCVYVCVCMCV